MEIRVFNETKRKIKKSLIERIEKEFKRTKLTGKVSKKACNLIIYTPKKISKLNKELFDRTGHTDVISVPNPIENSDEIGDIYICLKVVEDNAKRYKTTLNEEFTRIIVHGILHLLGFQHKKSFGESNEEMFKVQEDVVRKIFINNQL